MMMGWVMERGVDAYLAGVAAKGLALLVLTAVAALALRRSSSASRHWAWLLGLAGLLVLPVVGLVAPRWTVKLPEAVSAAKLQTPPVRRERGAAEPAELREARGEGGTSTGAPQLTDLREVAAPPTVTPGGERPQVGRTSPTRPRDRDGLPAGAVLLALWAIGAAGLLMRLLGSHVALWRVQAVAHLCPGGPVAARARSLAGRVGIRRPVRVLQGEPDAVPMSWGIVRPTILLPSGAGSWPGGRVDAVLLHELAHVRRRDCLAQLVAEVAVAVHWYNPLAWFAAHRLRVEREHACDDDVLRQGTRASRYASELVALARELRSGPVGMPAAVPILGPADLRARVRAVLDARRPRTLPGRVVGAGVAVAAAVVLALATVTPAQARTEVREADGAAAASPPRAAAVASVSDRPAQAATCGMATDGWTRSSISSNDGDRTTLRWSRPGCTVDVRVEGVVDFTDDFRAVAGLARGALVRIEETDGGTRRWLEITGGPDGRPTYQYRVDGQDQDFGPAARAWYAGMVLQVVRRSGYRAEERVAGLLRAGGVSAVLAELEALTADHVFAVYVEQLLLQSDLTEDQAVALVERARTRIDSDHYMAGILMALADRHLTSPRGVDAFLAAAGTLESDHYRAEVLGHALEHRTITQGQVATLLDAVAGMESDHYVAQVLLTVAGRYLLDEGMRATYLRAVRSVESDHYRAEVLGALLERNDLSEGELSDVLAAVSEMESEHYQMELLKRFASDRLSAADMDRYLTIVAGMESDHYQSEALLYLSLMDLSDADLRRVIDGVTLMDSDHYKAALLVELAEQDRVHDGPLYDAMLRAMNTIQSRHSRGEVAESLLRG